MLLYAFVSYVWALFVMLCCGGCVGCCEVCLICDVGGVFGGVPLWVVCVFRRVMLWFVSVVHPVAILNAVLCYLQLVVTIWWYSSMGIVICLYVARIVSLCFLYVVDVSACVCCM